MIAARGPDAARRGELLLILGELHTGCNTLVKPLYLNQHPRPSDLEEALVSDLPDPRVAPVIPSDRFHRAVLAAHTPHDYDVALGSTPSSRPRSQVLEPSALVVTSRNGSVLVETRDGSLKFDVVAFYEQQLMFQSLSFFGLLSDAPHLPRVTIDGLVVSRERWSLSSSDLPFLTAQTAVARFAETRRWAQRLGLPRFVFVRVPEEIKPLYFDLESPHFVELLARTVRGSSAVTVTEMLPAPDQVWLCDADGLTYVSELRVVMIDPTVWRAP
jgi:hypothetical protein